MSEEIVRRGEDADVGVVAEAEAGGKAGFLEIDGAGGGGDGFEILPDFVKELLKCWGGGAGRSAGGGVVRADFHDEGAAAGELGGGDAACG